MKRFSIDKTSDLAQLCNVNFNSKNRIEIRCVGVRSSNSVVSR